MSKIERAEEFAKGADAHVSYPYRAWVRGAPNAVTDIVRARDEHIADALDAAAEEAWVRHQEGRPGWLDALVASLRGERGS